MRSGIFAASAFEYPEEPVRTVVYRIANEQTLRDLVREFKATGPAYRQHLHTVMKSAYRSHYRAMLIRLLNTPEFHSNNDTHRPVLDELANLSNTLAAGCTSMLPRSRFLWKALYEGHGRRP